MDSGAWLNDLHISAAQKILHGDFPQVGSLQPPVLGSKQMFTPVEANNVQILNFSGHWGCITTIDCKPGHVNVYDSLYPTPPMSLVRQLCCLLRTNEKNLEVHMMDMQTQSGLNDLKLPVQLHSATARIHLGSTGHRVRCVNTLLPALRKAN